MMLVKPTGLGGFMERLFWGERAEMSGMQGMIVPSRGDGRGLLWML